MIRQACMDDTISFGGHYTIGGWSCGSECRMIAVIDRITGRIFFSSKYIPFKSELTYDIAYKKNSRFNAVKLSPFLSFGEG